MAFHSTQYYPPCQNVCNWIGEKLINSRIQFFLNSFHSWWDLNRTEQNKFYLCSDKNMVSVSERACVLNCLHVYTHAGEDGSRKGTRRYQYTFFYSSINYFVCLNCRSNSRSRSNNKFLMKIHIYQMEGARTQTHARSQSVFSRCTERLYGINCFWAIVCLALTLACLSCAGLLARFSIVCFNVLWVSEWVRV